MNALAPPPTFASFIPENAPFSAEQRAWLNGFFAGVLSPEPSIGAVAPAAEAVADEDDEARPSA